MKGPALLGKEQHFTGAGLIRFNYPLSSLCFDELYLLKQCGSPQLSRLVSASAKRSQDLLISWARASRQERNQRLLVVFSGAKQIPGCLPGPGWNKYGNGEASPEGIQRNKKTAGFKKKVQIGKKVNL